MITEWEFVAQAMREEVEEHGALLNFFEEQQTAILQRDTELVLKTESAIATQLRTIRACRKRREEMVRKTALEVGLPGDTRLSELVDSFPSAAAPLLHALISEVNRLVRQTQRRARQNHLLLARTIEVSQELLRRLDPAALSQTYSAKGQVKIQATTGAQRVTRS